MKEKAQKKFGNLFGMASLSLWIKLIWTNGFDLKYFPRLASLLFVSLLTSPLRLIETILYKKKVNRTKIAPSPIFILGHYRSGTTLLHNLLIQAPEFGYVTTFQAIAPGFAILGDGKIKEFLSHSVNGQRPMDNMNMSINATQEEEIGVANLSPYSYLHYFSFPKNFTRYLNEYLLLEGISKKELKKRRTVYLHFLRKVTFLSKGKRLILKNPVNTAQISFLLEMFPNAKFIHIHRNPYDVFTSTTHFFQKIQPAHVLQKIESEQVRTHIFKIYEGMMKKLIQEKELIPSSNFIEVRFEDLEKNKLKVLEEIYSTLDLPEFDKNKIYFASYIRTLKEYSKNKYAFTKENINDVNKHWGFAFEKWGYERMNFK